MTGRCSVPQAAWAYSLIAVDTVGHVSGPFVTLAALPRYAHVYLMWVAHV